jgi:two-component system sensor histidine kinase MtrB
LTPRVFGRDDTELLQLVAERVALAIERSRVHQELIELDMLKLNFVAVASHELRTPATSVYGILATLRARGDTLSAETRAQLEEALWGQTLRLRRLIEQLLDLSRLDAETLHLEPQLLRLDLLLRDVIAGLEGSEAIILHAAEGLRVRADPTAVERVVSNLVSNARRYGQPPIVVTAQQTDSQIRIGVADEGEGVPPALRPRLFQRFERADGTGTGSGLGLAIARAYARAHGGDVIYEPLPRGSRFEFFFPAIR